MCRGLQMNINTDVREIFIKEYWDNKKPLKEIANEYKIPLTTLFQRFNELGIRTRTRKQAQKNYVKKQRKKR